jgi:HJR/Mrr/RecB family endonuclease
LLLPELLSPALITIVAGSSNLRLAQDFISLTITDWLKSAPIRISGEATEWDYSTLYKKEYLDEFEDDFGVGLKRSGHVEEDESDIDPPEFSTSFIEGIFDWPKLSNITTGFLKKENLIKIINQSAVSQGDQNNIVFRLDIIDIALYKALLAHPELLHSFSWRTFEKLLADILESFGYEIELQRGTKDGGVDLFAIKRSDPLGPQRFLLQAKRWSNKVGIDPVRQLAFLHSHYRVTKACLATTSTFTRGAWEIAQQYKWQLELRDFSGLQEWIRNAAIIKSVF